MIKADIALMKVILSSTFKNYIFMRLKLPHSWLPSNVAHLSITGALSNIPPFDFMNTLFSQASLFG
jgi:hypothetical protein